MLCSGLVPAPPRHAASTGYPAATHNLDELHQRPNALIIYATSQMHQFNAWHALPFLKEILGRTLFRNWDRESRLFRVDRAIRRLRRNSKELKSSRKVIWITFAEAKLVYSLVLSRAFLSLEETTDTLGKKMQVSLHRLSKDRHELYYYFEQE